MHVHICICTICMYVCMHVYAQIQCIPLHVNMYIYTLHMHIYIYVYIYIICPGKLGVYICKGCLLHVHAQVCIYMYISIMHGNIELVCTKYACPCPSFICIQPHLLLVHYSGTQHVHVLCDDVRYHICIHMHHAYMHCTWYIYEEQRYLTSSHRTCTCCVTL
jgi:hypothetical protein